MEKTTKYTPQSISESTEIFNIPLYQRLFEWGELQIEQLMSDLLDGFLIKPNDSYYIGMLTSYKNDLVDGQQRFTVLMLMAIAFNWSGFLKAKDNSIRLRFFARKKDEAYLNNLIEPKENNEYKNVKMEIGINTILNFMKKEDTKEKLKKNEKNEVDFIKFIFENLTFFISELPNTYQQEDLNKYFESMNAAGKGLENHEILKVDLLKKLPENSNKEFYTRIWNIVSDMDKQLIRPKYENNAREDSSKTNERQKLALVNSYDTSKSFTYCNDSNKSAESASKMKIKDIPAKNEPPKTSIRSIGERAILNFPEFLLQVLWLQLSEEERKITSNFFNVHKLQETFKEYLHNEKVELFFQNLLKYRLLFDYFIIRISNKEGNTSTYTLVLKEDEIDNSFERQKLIQYQSMLYVSTTSYSWLTDILQKVTDKPADITPESMFNSLVNFDNARHKLDISSLTYEKINRYWFWRLDYYLWENREKYFTGKAALDVAKNYVFRTNRSIEHISPQTPEENSLIKLDKDTMLDWFGNLAMISSGQNSSLQNRSFEVKQAHVKSFINESKNGSIESLKLLKVLDFETWNEYKVKAHGNEMIDILIESFPTDGYEEIKSELNKSKLI